MGPVRYTEDQTLPTRFAKDLADVLAWIDGGPEPTTVKRLSFSAGTTSKTMTSRLSAAYKGVHALLMHKQARDFLSGQSYNQTSYFDEAVDIHHSAAKPLRMSVTPAASRIRVLAGTGITPRAPDQPRQRLRIIAAADPHPMA